MAKKAPPRLLAKPPNKRQRDRKKAAAGQESATSGRRVRAATSETVRRSAERTREVFAESPRPQAEAATAADAGLVAATQMRSAGEILREAPDDSPAGSAATLVDPKLAAAPIGVGLTDAEAEIAVARGVADLTPLAEGRLCTKTGVHSECELLDRLAGGARDREREGIDMSSALAERPRTDTLRRRALLFAVVVGVPIFAVAFGVWITGLVRP